MSASTLYLKERLTERTQACPDYHGEARDFPYVERIPTSAAAVIVDEKR